MSAPALPTWDSGLVHVTSTPSGWQTSGFATDDIPLSDVENYWRNLVCQNFTFLRNQGTPGLLQQFVPDITSSDNPDPEYTGQDLQTDSVYALAPNPGVAFLKQGSANNKIKIAAGTLLQLSGGQFLAYTFDGTTELTIADGDATNPRVDIIQMAVDTDTAQSATVTVSVKQGTPASSPTYPAPDDGYCVIAGVVVGAAYAGAAGFHFEDTAGATAVIHDQRLPLRIRSHVTTALESVVAPSHVTQPIFGVVQVDGSTDLTYMPKGDVSVGRIMGVAVGFSYASALTSKIGKVKLYENSGTTYQFTETCSGGVNGGVSGFGLKAASAAQWATGHAPAAGPTIQANANGMGVPIWTNGKHAPDQPFTTGSVPIPFETVGLNFASPPSTAEFGPCVFYIATGL